MAYTYDAGETVLIQIENYETIWFGLNHSNSHHVPGSIKMRIMVVTVSDFSAFQSQNILKLRHLARNGAVLNCLFLVYNNREGSKGIRKEKLKEEKE